MKYTLKYIRSLVSVLALISVFACWTADMQAQHRKVTKTTPISITITDTDGNPVPYAEVIVDEGTEHLTADVDGSISFSADPRDIVTISKDGYDSVNALVSALMESRTVSLAPEVFLASERDDIPLPYFSTEKKRNTVGSAIVIKGEDLEKYSSTDIRNALTAIAAGVEVTEGYWSPGVSAMEHISRYGSSYRTSVSMRGLSPVYMVDDIPVNIDETPLDPQQIESITIVRDIVDKTAYGASGANGIIYIKTKRGKYNDRYMNVEVEGGINVVDRMPEFVSGADYARLNNLARNNSGLDMLYTREDIEAYSLNDPYDLWHPSVDYRSMMLKNTMYYTKASVSSGGGNDNLRYFAYLGYAGEDDMLKMGANSAYNRVNINANLDIKLHRYIRARLGIVSTMGVRTSANYGYSSSYSSEDESSNSTLGIFEVPDILNDIRTIPAIAFPVYANNDPSLEDPWYAVSSQFTRNPIGNLLANGSYTETTRKGLMNVAVDVDFGFLTKGLKSTTYLAYDATNVVRLGKAEDYAAYILREGIDNEGQPAMIPEQSSSHSVKKMSGKTKLLDYFSNRFYLVEKLSYDRTFGKHDVSANATYMITKRSQKFITEHRREMNFGFGAKYAYDGKYIVQLAMNGHGTYSLLYNTWGFSPSIGLGWIMSEENFLKHAEGLDFLKLRVQGGMLDYDSATSANRDVDNYSWNENGQTFGPYKNNNSWLGSDVSGGVDRTYISMLGNPNLRMERRYELTAGIDGVALDRRLNFSLNYWYRLQDGPISELANIVPLLTGTSSGAFWDNYEQTRYQGGELSLGWHDRIGDFTYGINGWASTQFSKVLRADELNYPDRYRSQVGYSASAAWGLRYLGQFATDEEALEVPQLFDEKLQAGDFKYQDMNGDGYVDDNDACVIGDYNPKLIYGITVSLKYKDFDLFLAGTGRSFYDIALTNSYFWNGWGDNNYSKYTLEHAGDPTAPRITYYKVNNNFKTSDYWLAKGDYFKLQTVEIGYQLPCRKLGIRVLRGLRVYLRGNNICTLSGIKDIDPESSASGVDKYPLVRTFVAGLKLTF